MNKWKLLMMILLLCAVIGGCRGNADKPDDGSPAEENETEQTSLTPAPSEEPDASDAPETANPLGGTQQSTIPPITWRLAPTKYETKDAVVMAYDIRDFGVMPDSGEDVSRKIQTALLYVSLDGGGTVFLPEGQYIIETFLNIPKGVTLCGDWQDPTAEPEVSGTVLLAYSGRGTETGTPFITLQPNASIRDLSIWYPEQTADAITAYPVTVRLYDPTVWGADYTHVKNVTFVNSYFAIQQGPAGSGCPNVRNVFGTPLKTGISMDGIADVGRVDYVNFAPDFWENSGLANAPSADSPLREYLYENATGITMGRVDWSYFTHTDITGYAVGMELRSGEMNEEGNYPNGQVFRHTYNHCKVGVKVSGTSSVGEAFSELTLNDCETGILVDFNEGARDTYVQFFNSTIDASEYAVMHQGVGEISFLQSEIKNGQIYSDRGTVMISATTVSSAAPQITLDQNSAGLVLSDAAFTQERQISNLAKCRIIEEKEVIPRIELNEIPDCFEEEKKPERLVLYVAELDGKDSSDVTEELQKVLDLASSEGGGIVFVPPGEYQLTGGVTVPAGVELKGAVDVGRNPIRTGTIFRIRTENRDNDGLAAVTLKENSGIRGIVFDYPEQDFTNPHVYPYAVRGEGSGVYIVNVSLRGAYNGVDLMTNQCDSHYVEYLSGICLNNVIKLGGGSKDGKLLNMQVNYICITAGDESKFGTWDNAPKGETKDADVALLEKFIQENLEVVVVGDVENELLFDNFSFNGNIGIRFIEENGKAASGFCVGHGIDFSCKGFYIEKLGDLQFINSQVVSFKRGAITEPDICHIVLGETVDSLVEFANVSGWAMPVNNIRVEGGDLRVYNARFFNVPTPSLKVSGTGSMELVNFSYKNDNDLSLASENQGNISVNGLLFGKSLLTEGGFRNLSGVMRNGVRFSVPDEMLSGTDGIYLFADDFTNYPAMDQNDVTAALQGGGSFNEIQSPSAGSSVSLKQDASGAAALLYCADTGVYSYMKTNGFALNSGGSYTIEMKVKADAMSSKEGIKLLSSIQGYKDGVDAGVELLLDMNQDGQFYVRDKALAGWEKGVWYYIVVEFDLTEEGNRTYQVSLYHEDKIFAGASPDILLREELQSGSIVLKDLQIGLLGALLAGTGTSEVLVDYVVVYE